jgi:hypothetical protein
MYYNCKNKTLSLSFYDTDRIGNRFVRGGEGRDSTQSEFERNLPDVYYKVDCAAGLSRMTVFSWDSLVEDYSVLSVDQDFRFTELAERSVEDYTLYVYSDFSKFSGGGIYEESKKYLKYDAALFVQIFRILGESVTLMFRSQNKVFMAHYIDGKVLISEIIGNTYVVSVSTLFAMNKKFMDYEIIDYNPYPTKMRQRHFLEQVEKFCSASGLRYVKDIV